MNVLINKKQIIVLLIIFLIILLCFITDFILIKTNNSPVFCITIPGRMDGGTIVYYGVGYKIIYTDKYTIGTWFLDENKYSNMTDIVTQ